MKKNIILTADFETTTVVKKKNENFKEYRERVKLFEPQIYSWALCKKINNKKGFHKDNYEIKDGINMFSFIEEIQTLKEDSTMYFHNGAGFDIHFLLPYLNFLKYKQLIVVRDNYTDGSKTKLSLDDKYENTILNDKPRKLNPYEYTILVDSSHKIMEMKIGLESYKMRNGEKIHRVLIIRDTLLMFPSTLAQFGVSLNKHYDTDKFTKKDLEGGYTKTDVYKNYKEYIQDGNEQEYLHQDVIILQEFIQLMIQTIPFHKWQMTGAGTTFKIWKYDFFGKELLESAIKEGNVEEVVLKNGFKKYKWKGSRKLTPYRLIVNRLFTKYFPVDWLNGYFINGIEQNFKLIHQSYQGGLTMANSKLAGKTINNSVYIDINSSYPTQMMNNLFPIGAPSLKSLGKNSLKLYSITIENMTNKKGLPFLYDFIKKGEGKHYPQNLKDKEFILTDIEFKNFKKYYKGKYSHHIVCYFNSITGKKLFGSFIDFFYKMKSNPNSSVAEVIYAKRMLNSLYGKFGQDVSRESKLYLNGSWESVETIDDAVYYLPLASWITAYARMYMVDAVGDKFENVVVLDTDSLTIKIPDEIYEGIRNVKGKYVISSKSKKWIEENYNVILDPEKLGSWDIEYLVKKVNARRAKQYMLITDQDKKVIKYAGLRLKGEQLEGIGFEEFVMGKKGIQQLRPYRTPTGLILETYEKELKEIWRYNLNPDYWFKDEKTFKKKLVK